MKQPSGERKTCDFSEKVIHFSEVETSAFPEKVIHHPWEDEKACALPEKVTDPSHPSKEKACGFPEKVMHLSEEKSCAFAEKVMRPFEERKNFAFQYKVIHPAE